MSKKARQEGRTDRTRGKGLADGLHPRYGYSQRKGVIFTESDDKYEERQAKREAYKEGWFEKRNEEKGKKK